MNPAADERSLQRHDLGDGYIPVIDIAPYFSGRQADRLAVAEQIGQACRDVGFYIIVGHGVPEELVAAVDSNARAFFDLPLDGKMKVHAGNAAGTCGYAAVGERSFAYTRGEKSPPDLHESFQVSKLDADPGDPYFQTPIAKKLVPPNQWPDGQPQLRSVLTDYYRRMAILARDLLRLSALALDLPETWFDDKIDHHISRLSLKLYPQQKVKPLPGQLRAGAHTDYGTVTILRAGDAVGGLQVADARGNWHDMPIIAHSFIINQGDMMARWTNHHWLSTLHRVVNPPEEAMGGNRRLSIVFFHTPNYDTLVECLPTCVGPGDSPKYQPVSVADYYALKRQQQRGAT
jgi:isopenicillin N synthase-like dioxygenase